MDKVKVMPSDWSILVTNNVFAYLLTYLKAPSSGKESINRHLAWMYTTVHYYIIGMCTQWSVYSWTVIICKNNKADQVSGFGWLGHWYHTTHHHHQHRVLALWYSRVTRCSNTFYQPLYSLSEKSTQFAANTSDLVQGTPQHLARPPPHSSTLTPSVEGSLEQGGRANRTSNPSVTRKNNDIDKITK